MKTRAELQAEAAAITKLLDDRDLTTAEQKRLDEIIAELRTPPTSVKAVAPGAPAILSGKGGSYSLERAVKIACNETAGGLEHEVSVQLSKDNPKADRQGFVIPSIAMYPKAQKAFRAIMKSHGTAVASDAWWELSTVQNMPELQVQLGAAMMADSLLGKLGLTAVVSNSLDIRIPQQTGKLVATTFALDAAASMSPDASFDTLKLQPVTAGALTILKRSAFYESALGESGESFLAGQLGKAIADELENVFINGSAGLVLALANVLNSTDSGIAPASSLSNQYGQQFLSLVRAWQAYNQRAGDNSYKMLIPQSVMDGYMTVPVSTDNTDTFDSIFKLSGNMIPTFTLPVTTGTPDTAPVYCGDFSSYVLWISQAAEILPNPFIQVSGQPGYNEGATWLRVLQDYQMQNRDPGQIQSIPDVQILS